MTGGERRWLVIAATVAAFAVAGLAVMIGVDRYRERYAVTADAGADPVTRVVTARLSGASSLKVAALTGTVQSRATDIRGFGWLRSDQVVKMPYSVDYFVDAARIGPGEVEWDAKTRTLIVSAPDISVAPPNIDEGSRTMVQTTGVIVTRKASEALTRQVSRNAAARARTAAMAPERIAQAREMARAALANLLAAPLRTLGHGDARVIVTFPQERRRVDGERWDVSRSVEEVIGNAR